MIEYNNLKEILDYNPDTGIFRWKIRIAANIFINDVAGTIKYGYVLIRIYGKEYRAHRLAWFYMTGEWPKNQIDHINLIKDDNRWINLREATNSQNKGNCLKQKTNNSGYKGVFYNKRDKVWTAQISINSKNKHLGSRNNPEECYELYKKAALDYFGEFARF